MKSIQAKKVIGKSFGQMVDEGDYDVLVSGEAVEVYREDGSLLLRYIPEVIKNESHNQAWGLLRRAATFTDNRGVAGGASKDGATRIKKEGSNVTRAVNRVQSGVVGFFERRGGLNPLCRMTAFTQNNYGKYIAAVPFFKEVADLFREQLPERFASQQGFVDSLNPEYVIPGTPFTTITVNRNYRTAVHVDKGDFPGGFGILSVVEAGKPYEGGHLVFPNYRVAVDMRTGGILFCDVHEPHANTPLVGPVGRFERITFICYARTKLKNCLAPRQEMERARQHSKSIYTYFEAFGVVGKFMPRSGTSDEKAIKEVWKSKFYFQKGVKPEKAETWVDLGANVGAFSVLASMLGAKVMAYEAEPRNAKETESNVLLNEGAGVEVINAAVVADEICTGEITLNVRSNPSGFWRHSVVITGKGDEHIKVKAIPFSESILGADGVKMDIEGAEIAILTTAKSFGELTKLVIEWSFDADNRMATLRKAIDNLELHGFTVLMRKLDWSKELAEFYPPQVYLSCIRQKDKNGG